MAKVMRMQVSDVDNGNGDGNSTGNGDCDEVACNKEGSGEVSKSNGNCNEDGR